ncbi:MAG: response regulator transcription factor, partial [Eggerthellaceae bacterium]
FSLYLIPQAVTAFLIPLVFLPLFGLTIVLKSREIDLDQAMFQDVPRDHPLVYQRLVNDYWRSALCVGALGFCTGIMRSLAIGEPAVGSLVNVLSMGGSLTAAISLLVLWQFKNLSVNVVGAYRVFFPFVITSFLLLPFLPEEYARWLAGLYAVYSVAIMLMMIQCASRATAASTRVHLRVLRRHRVRAARRGSRRHVRRADNGIAPLAVVALVVVPVGAHTSSDRAVPPHLQTRQRCAASIELVALRAHAPEKSLQGRTRRRKARRRGAEGGRGDRPPARAASCSANASARSAYPDRISKQAALLQQHYRLSERETEVMELIARGNTVARIAEDLVVTENTIRTH